jgi:hypothetical protein
VARAQVEPSPKFNDVFVRSTDGVEMRVKLLDLQPATLSLWVEGSRRDIPLESIDRIQAPGDSLANGALIGASIAGAFYGAKYGMELLPFAAAGTVGWSAIGAGIDALIPGRTTIYSKPPTGGAASGNRRVGLAVKFGL